MWLRRTGVSALAGLVVAGMFATMMVARGETHTESPAVDVPTSRVGDEVTFRGGRVVGGSMVEQTWTVRIEGLDETLDRSANLTPVVVLSWNPGPVCRFEYETCHRLARSYVSLASRTPIRFDEVAAYRELPVQDRGVDRYTYFGPPFSIIPSGATNYTQRTYPFHEVGLAGAVYQGRSYRVAQDVSNETLRFFFQHAGIVPEDAARLNYRSWVEGSGSSGDHPLLLIRSRGSFVVPAVAELAGARQFLHQNISLRDVVEFETSAWVSPKVPYPVVQTERTWVNGATVQEWRTSVTSYKPGKGVQVPWNDEVAGPPASHNPWAERGPPRSHRPHDGNGSHLPYRLADALSNVASDPTLAGFAVWKNTRPAHFLAGLHLKRDSTFARPSLDAWTWELVFGDLPGDFFLLSSTKQPSGAIVNREYGSQVRANSPLAEIREVDRYVALATAEKIWRDTADKGQREEPLTTLRWGVTWLCLDYYIYTTPVQCGKPPVVWFDQHIFRHMYFAHRRDDLANRDERMSIYEYEINAVTGNLVHMWRVNVSHSEVRPESASGEAFWHVRLDRSQASRHVAAINEPAAIISATFLLGAMLGYFYPIARVAVGHAIAALPGYAKLMRHATLDHRTRDQLRHLIETEPGITPPELQRRGNAAWTTLVYHLRVLERNGFVSSLVVGRHKHLFPAGSPQWGRRQEVVVLRNATTRAIFEAILREPGVHQESLARRTGLTSSGARWHLRRLHSANLVKSQAEGKKLLYFPRGADVDLAQRPPPAFDSVIWPRRSS